MGSMNLKLVAFLFVFLFSAFSSAAILVDGKLDEPEWQEAQKISNFLTVYPNDKSKPKFKTEVRIFSNKKGIYFGFSNEQIGRAHV